MKIDLYLTPVVLDPVRLAHKSVVVIDVLRATTSICAALQSGARTVIPVDEPGVAGDMYARLGSNAAVLAGERGGVRIENFQLGNSPLEFTPEAVGGKSVIMTTTNGTRTFVRAGSGGLVLAGALVNVAPLAARVAQNEADLVILCAGLEGHFSIEDTICGGMIIHILKEDHGWNIDTNDAGSLALLLYQTNRSRIHDAVARGEHGRYLASIGFADDVAVAADVDSMPVVPVFRDGRLTLEAPAPKASQE